MDASIIERPIPGSGQLLPVIGVGTWETFDVYQQPNELQQLKKVLSTLYEKGGRVIDTSPMYGYAERVVGQLSSDLSLNDKLFVATKVWTRGQEKGIEQMNTSFKYLQRKEIDLMQVHNLVDWQTHLKTLRDWKEQGKIKYIGITHYQESAYSDLEKVMKTEPIDFLQVNYNVADTEAEQRLLPLAQEKKIAVIISQPFGYGKLFGAAKNKPLPGWAKEVGATAWSQLFLKYVISNPAVTCAIPGTGKPEHMLENVMAGYGELLSEAQRKELVNTFK